MLNRALLKKLSLRNGEKILGLVRRSLWYYFWPMALAIILIVLAFFLIYPLFRWGWWGIAIFGLLILVGFWLILRTYFSRSFTVFVMTDRRIIDLDQKGIFGRTISEALYSKIQDVSCEARGLRHAILRLGDVYIDLVARGRIKLKLTAVRNPHKIVSQILYLQEHYLKNGPAENLEAEFLLNKIRRKIGDEAFDKLIED